MPGLSAGLCLAEEVEGLLGFRALLFGKVSPSAGESGMLKRHCVWFKRDLRVNDHLPLVEAAEAGAVIPLYIIEPEVIGAADFDALHWNFICESLLALSDQLRARGQELQVKRGGEVDVLQEIHRRYHIAGLWSHEETGNALTYQRDFSNLGAGAQRGRHGRHP